MRSSSNFEGHDTFGARRRKLILLCLTILFTISITLNGCIKKSATPRLRLINDGTYLITDLKIVFPKDQLEFGDIKAGAITEYKDVPNGVYRYAAYKYQLNGKEITQPVIDWVGETPLEGISFTYTIAYDPNRPQGQAIQLLEVTKD
ncbi:MAG: hypothetical protein ACYDHA_14545 [Bellilinea sp.]